MISAGIRRSMAGVTLGSGSTPVGFSDGTVAAAGSDETDAALLLYAVNRVTGADGTKGVILPVGAPGQIVQIYNDAGDGSGLNVYPPSGGTINGGTGDAAVLIEDLTLAIFVCTDGTNWGAQYTANS